MLVGYTLVSMVFCIDSEITSGLAIFLGTAQRFGIEAPRYHARPTSNLLKVSSVESIA